MNIKNLNSAFVKLAGLKERLSSRLFPVEREDLLLEIKVLEEVLEMEYGALLEEALFSVYDEYCPDDEVRSPAAYVAGRYIETAEINGYWLDVDPSQGVPVEADDFPGVSARLVWIPEPTRLVLHNEYFKEVVWEAPLAKTPISGALC